MNCIIPSQNLKLLSKAINSLAKVGDEIYLEANEEQMKFTTSNISKTVCSQCSFMRSFFSSYDVNKVDTSEKGNENITCKLFMKSILPLFKGNLEKKLEFLSIELKNDSDFILLKMKYKFDQIIMIHKLRLMDSETLCVGLTPNGGINNLCGTSTLFTQLLSMFNLTDSEITLEIVNSRLVARNYYTGAASNPKLMRVEIKLSAGEFLVFDVKNDTNINFALKPSRTVISFAENFNLVIGLNFDSGGKPLTISMKHPTFNIHFIVSTLNPSRDVQSSMASTSLPMLTQRNMNIAVEDQQNSENDNWGVISNSQSQNNSFVSMINRASSTRSGSTEISSSAKCQPKNRMEMNEDDYCDVVNESSQCASSPRRKKIKLIFSRCYEPTILQPDLGREYLGNSDSE